VTSHTFAQTRAPTLRYPHQSCRVGWSPGHSQPRQVSSKSVQRFWLPEGFQSAILLCLALWLIYRDVRHGRVLTFGRTGSNFWAYLRPDARYWELWSSGQCHGHEISSSRVVCLRLKGILVTYLYDEYHAALLWRVCCILTQSTKVLIYFTSRLFIREMYFRLNSESPKRRAIEVGFKYLGC